MKQHTFLALLGMSLSGLLLSGCNSEPETPAGPAGGDGESQGRIGMTCMDLTNPFFKLIADEMTAGLARHGYEMTALDGAKDGANQNTQLSDFVAQGVDAIFLNPADSKTAAEGVRRAHKAGIPVFTFDVQIDDKDAKQLVTYHIGSDNFQGGQLAGKSMMEATGDRGKIAIIGLPEVTSCILRVDGFKDYLATNDSTLEIVTELNGKGDRSEAYNVAADILNAHSDIVGIFAINDPSALGAYEAVDKAGLTDQITIVAFDASPQGKKGVYEKKLYDTPRQFPRKMAEGTVAAFIKHLEGEEFEKSTFIPCEHYHFADAEKDEGRDDW